MKPENLKQSIECGKWPTVVAIPVLHLHKFLNSIEIHVECVYVTVWNHQVSCKNS